MREEVEHAGRVVRVRVVRSPTDVSVIGSTSKSMIVIDVKAPNGDFSVSLPVKKAGLLANLIIAAVNEELVRNVMKI